MHLAADATGQKRFLSAIFAIAHNWVTDCLHVNPQLVGPAGQRLQLNPSGAIAHPVDHAITSLGTLAFFLIDMHFLAASARLLGQRGIDRAFEDFGHANHQRPVNFARAATGKAFGEGGSRAGRSGDQKDARCVLVQPVDQTRARRFAFDEGIKQAVDMLGCLAAALGGKAGWLVEHDGGLGLGDDHGMGLGHFGCGQVAFGFGFAGLFLAARGHAQGLAFLQPVFGFGAFAIDPDLAGPRPARHGGKADLRQIAFEPTIEANPGIVLAYSKLAHFCGGLGGVVRCHAVALMVSKPTNNAATPAATETAI